MMQLWVWDLNFFQDTARFDKDPGTAWMLISWREATTACLDQQQLV
jgi:hypothetical protein